MVFPVTITNWSAIGTVWDGASSYTINNGSLNGPINIGTNGHSNMFRVGGWAAYASSFFYEGDIAELLIFPQALSAANRQAVELYLNAKWAIY